MTSNELTDLFAQRVIDDLPTNNTLRGSWAEQVVAHFLDVRGLPPNWTYFDLRLGEWDISVKHSVGPNARFSVDMSKWAWDPGEPKLSPEEGWLGGDEQYWCHVYVFAWLDCKTSVPPLETVIEPQNWQFAVLSRAEMYRRFVLGRTSPQQTSSRRALSNSWIWGDELAGAVANAVKDAGEDVPDRVMTRWAGETVGAPTIPNSPPLPPERLGPVRD